MAKTEATFSVTHYESSNCKCLPIHTSTRKLKSNLPWYFKAEHVDNVLNALEAIETDVLLRKPIRWNMLRIVLRAMRVNNRTSPYCLNFARDIFKLFERHQCKDLNVISEMFLFMFFLTAENLKWYGGIPLIKSVLEKDFVRTPYVEIKKFFCMPYGPEQSKMDLVWHVARRGNLDLLKLQLKFGMGMMIPRFDATSCSAYIEQLLLLSRYAIDRKDRKEIFSKICSNFNHESEKRLCFVLRMVEIVLKMQQYPRYREQFAECYRLLLDSIPEAYVTSGEVKAFLEKCLPDRCFSLIPKLIKDFKGLLPEVADVPQSRSLQHLCRIQVRQCLRQNLNLPHGVSSLQLPKLLKNYIMLHDDGDFSVIIKTTLDYNWEMDCITSPSSLIYIPEKDDCIISFLKYYW